MINLNNVTLCIVDCLNYENASKAIIYCSHMCNISFANTIFLSDHNPKILEKYNVQYKNIKKINSSRDYSNFMIGQLHKYIETDFMLVIQHDGIIYNPKKWTDDFLNYDYIGAPWSRCDSKNRYVGNGGFSLRSKKLMKYVSEKPFNQYFNRHEDSYICWDIADELEQKGFIFPDIHIASKFSTETETEFSDIESFGFHIPSLKDNIGNEKHKNFLKEIKNINY